MRSIQSLSKFFLITGLATTTAWYSHPHLLNLAAHVLHLDFKVRALSTALPLSSIVLFINCLLISTGGAGLCDSIPDELLLVPLAGLCHLLRQHNGLPV